MRFRALLLPSQLVVSIALVLCTMQSTPPAVAEEKVDFEKQILPVLDSACFKCHSARAKKIKGDLRLDDVAAIRAKSRSDNLVFPRKPEKSLLFHVVSLPAGDEDVMPPPDENKPLSAEQIALIRTWIRQGANFGEWKSAAARPKAVAAEAPSVNPADVAGTARRIDELIEAHLTKSGRKPNPPVADDLWCRRVYLDLAGRIPTFEEIHGFLASKDPSKRSKLIDALLVSNGHVSTMFNYWCDVLRARDTLADNARGDFYLQYIKGSIRANKPYDQWAREMISSDGSLWQAPAVGYHLRDFGNRFASVDNTAMVFLGTQIGCAQCHDHPYDEWSRKAYHQFAAWTSAIEAKRSEASTMAGLSEGDLISAQTQLEKLTQRRTSSPRKQLENTIAMQLFEGMMGKLMRERPAEFSVRSGAQPSGKLPGDYQYPDGKPNEAVRPAVLFGQANPKPGQRPAEAFAEWLTSPENPRFALNVANRMWARLLGAPFSGTIESVRDPQECQNPDLARYLTQLMIATKFDLRQFQRIVAGTRTYARQSAPSADRVTAYDFPGPVLRRMSAEQVWDSLMTLAVTGLDSKIRFETPDTSEMTQVASITDTDKLLAMVRAQAKEQASAKLTAMRRHAPPPKAPYAPSAEFSPNAMLRASELPQPAPEGHFLRVFGQSNREIADGGWRSGTVPQTLIMLNSSLFDAVVERGTPLYNALKRESGDSGRLRAVYLAILGRVPTVEETREISSTLHGTGNIEAIAHTLLGTRQFLFVQ